MTSGREPALKVGPSARYDCPAVGRDCARPNGSARAEARAARELEEIREIGKGGGGVGEGPVGEAGGEDGEGPEGEVWDEEVGDF